MISSLPSHLEVDLSLNSFVGFLVVLAALSPRPTGTSVLLCRDLTGRSHGPGCTAASYTGMGQLTGLRTGPLPVLLWLSTSRQPCMIITIHLFAAIERV